MTGRGRAFCAGADLGGGGATFDAGASAPAAPVDSAPRDGGGLVTLRIFECTKPVIAAMNGSAVGIGVTMTLPMDIRILADNAKVGFVFASRGIIPEAASSWFLPRVVGISQALEWCLTARVFGAAEALAGGLVRSVHPADEVLDVARGLADEIVTQRRARVGRPHPPDAVADARCRPPDGGTQARFARRSTTPVARPTPAKGSLRSSRSVRRRGPCRPAATCRTGTPGGPTGPMTEPEPGAT